MKHNLLTLIISLTAFVAEGMTQKVTVDPSEIKRLPALKDVTFGATVKGADEIVGRAVETPNDLWSGFVIFSCKASDFISAKRERNSISRASPARPGHPCPFPN